MVKKIIKEALSLVLIVLVAVVVLAVIHQFTKDRIQAAEQEEIILSYKKVFPSAHEFRTKEFEYAPSSDGITIQAVQEVLDTEGNVAGCVVSVLTPNGYGGDIVSSLGIDLTGKITGMTVNSMKETPGLGANCQNQEWQDQFTGISEFPLVYVKTGKTASNEIDALTSATKTTKAITDSINYVHEFVKAEFGYGSEVQQ